MTRNVRGSLFADYVRMIRGHKAIDWKRHLREDDLRFLAERIDPRTWYPMETFERMGEAILIEVAQRQVVAVRMWGRFQVDQLRAAQPELVAPRDPVETMNRFRILRATFFDFDALEVGMLVEDQAQIFVHYYMGATAEEAAAYQTMGFFERLLELAGASNITASFPSRSWVGDPRTLLELSWLPPI